MTLIKREDAIDAIDDAIDADSPQWAILRTKIGFLPSAESVEVVRCKDCYHAEDDITHMFCVYFGHKVYGDDYCSNAVERREDGEE